MTTNVFAELPSNLPDALFTTPSKQTTCASNESYRTAMHRQKVFGTTNDQLT
jgi:hypothetical protein